MASQLLKSRPAPLGVTTRLETGRFGNQRMRKDSIVRFTTIILALLTLATFVFAYINWQKEAQFVTSTDGVWWKEQAGFLVAKGVAPNGPGEKAGIKVGDRLLRINNLPKDQTIKSNAEKEHYLDRSGVYSRATYLLDRQGVSIEVTSVIPVPADNSMKQGLRLIALIYLFIGLYVLFRRWTAPKSTHFYIFCLVSFVLYSFHNTGKFNAFDSTIFWGNIVAELLQAALFLHFALTFPEKRGESRRLGPAGSRLLVSLVYLPGLLLLGWRIVAFTQFKATESLRWNIERLQMSYATLYFLLAAVVLWRSYRQASTPLQQQQLKWISRGTVLAIGPYTLFYVIPYIAGVLPTAGMKISVLSLVFLPVTWGYAIVRYRLMDVDIIFKRGVSYTLATAAIVGGYFAVVGGLAGIVQAKLPFTGFAGLTTAMLITALIFEPLKNWIQVRVDRFFYRKRYDYRRTLIEFGRELSSETDLSAMLISVIDRLSRTLLVDRIAIFLATDAEAHDFVLEKSFGISYAGSLDLGFLVVERPEQYAGHIFFDNTRKALQESVAARETIAKLNLNYYIPCTVQGRTIAVMGLGKTMAGDFLSSEDVELLETLAGYMGIAIQNARLYASLEQKASEYERLKDFNENIVESISVGVLAVDLEDRIESWNSQMEVMYAMPRSQVLGERLSEVFPAEFMEDFYRVRQNPGIHNLYKFRLQTRAGDTRIANVAIAPLVTRKFNVIGRLIIVDDITERMELESQLSQAEKLSSIGLLAAGVAHEVNTPLAVISSYAQMASKQVDGDAKIAPLLEKITRQTFRASEIVNNLLNFSRTSATEFSAIDLNKIITETLTLLEHQLKTSRVSVETELYAGLPLIHGNSGKLQQVFLNLFLNAKDAMAGKGGKLHISTVNGDSVQVNISDSGAGIEPEHINKIYDPFFTTKNVPREGQSRGTGLGLSVTYGIIQEHAGKIRVDSQPGQGTTFHLEFPMRKAVNV
ncbi:MAG TPA: ATP-binding protein [Candidatus Angelobacter sp.]|nr:ATP-binding protein [Candidatus Angelobacter sp.]